MSAVQSLTATNGRSPAELLKRVSASRLQTFHQCRLKFYFRYVLGLKRPKSPALHVGSAVHYVLQCWNRARWKGEPIDAAILRQMFGSYWVFEQADHPVAWEEESEPLEMASAWSLAEMYLNQSPIPLNEKPEAVEVEVEADLSQHGLPTLIGFIDLVRAGGRIVDFKTAAQTPNKDRAVHLHELQISCYGVLYRDATGQKEGGFELHHLVKLRRPSSWSPRRRRCPRLRSGNSSEPSNRTWRACNGRIGFPIRTSCLAPVASTLTSAVSGPERIAMPRLIDVRLTAMGVERSARDLERSK